MSGSFDPFCFAGFEASNVLDAYIPSFIVGWELLESLGTKVPMQLQESLSPLGFLDCILGHQDQTDHVACMDGFPSHTVHIADI